MMEIKLQGSGMYTYIYMDIHLYTQRFQEIVCRPFLYGFFVCDLVLFFWPLRFIIYLWHFGKEMLVVRIGVFDLDT